MEAKPTPGPWRYLKQNGSPTTGQHMIAGGKPGYLAEVRDCGSGDVEANARLIAAAPALLAALLAAVEWGAPMADAPRGSRPEWFDLARAALALAAGGAP